MINNQNRSRVYLIIIAILLVANIGMLTFCLQKKAPEKQQAGWPDRKTYISNFLKNEIGFNQDQLVKYDTLSKMQRERVGAFFEKLRTGKNMQFKELVAGNFSDTTIERLANQSATTQKTMEVNMFNHIKSIRLLCTPEQMPKFDTLFVKVFNRRGGDGRKKPAK